MNEPAFDAAALVAYSESLMFASGHPIRRDMRMLDFGCGNGSIVRALSDSGFVHAYGCDFVEELGEGDRLREIAEPYRLPFDDAAFDCVLSNQVFEHVMDYQQALAEIRRVLAPGGVSLHLFPPRYVFKEPHVFVPLATMFRAWPWLLLWARLGVRNQFQEGKPANEVARLNYHYLRDHTTYYSRLETLRLARRVFPQARLLELEQAAARSSGRGRLAYALACRVRPLATVWSETHGRALLLV